MTDYTYQNYPIRRIIEMASTGSLKLDPIWQRNFVWTRDQKPKLIDSLENGYPIPHLVIWTRPGGNYIMVDGKQRTETLISYTKDDFAYDNVLFSQKTEADKEAFLDKELSVLVFKVCVELDFINEYFERINTGSKHLSNGEMFNNLGNKPIVSKINSLFFQSGPFQTKWASIFGEPVKDIRMKCYENTVPYLTSSLYGDKCLSKSFEAIASKIKETDEDTLNKHMHKFEERMDLFMIICKSIFEACPDIKKEWTKQGLPPLRQLSPIWVTINNLEHYSEDLVTFWTSFYKNMCANPMNIKPQWDLYMRKNGSPKQFKNEIGFATIMYNV